LLEPDDELTRARHYEGLEFDKLSRRELLDPTAPMLTADLYYDPNLEPVRPRLIPTHLDVRVGHQPLPNHRNLMTEDLDAGCYEQIDPGVDATRPAAPVVVRAHLKKWKNNTTASDHFMLRWTHRGRRRVSLRLYTFSWPCSLQLSSV